MTVLCIDIKKNSVIGNLLNFIDPGSRKRVIRMDAIAVIFEKILRRATKEVGAYSFQCKSQRKDHLMPSRAKRIT